MYRIALQAHLPTKAGTTWPKCPSATDETAKANSGGSFADCWQEKGYPSGAKEGPGCPNTASLSLDCPRCPARD